MRLLISHENHLPLTMSPNQSDRGYSENGKLTTTAFPMTEDETIAPRRTVIGAPFYDLDRISG
jgi:hypothetical protein